MAFSRARDLAAVIVIAAVTVAGGACNRADTSAAVTTTSPAGSSVAPSGAAAKARDHALVRVVDAFPSGNLDLFAGDLILFDGIGFKSVSPYRALDGKRYAFALRPAGAPNAKALSSNTEDVNDGGYYTAFAIPGDGDEPRLRIVSDDLAPPASGHARVRVVHAGIDAGAVDVRGGTGTDALFSAVDYHAVSGYRDVAAMTGAIQISIKGSGTPAATLPDAQLQAGRYYTLVIVGRAPKLEAFLIEDALTP